MRGALLATRSRDRGSQQETVQQSGHLSASAAAQLVDIYGVPPGCQVWVGTEGALGLGSPEPGEGSTENNQERRK